MKELRYENPSSKAPFPANVYRVVVGLRDIGQNGDGASPTLGPCTLIYGGKTVPGAKMAPTYARRWLVVAEGPGKRVRDLYVLLELDSQRPEIADFNHAVFPNLMLERR